eukprot:CAMPEP_0194032096 /NCGR_PEP_ID=MMETSP0009_2-20130614/5117_1 /TAXON_ID=210454 /ORGANISM="Grammatophora oceanica, Strain CCMP 410" /LENGTH=280 /DNA_ID=CAMNT_0038672437 /DNA_START=84 /DNA_END=926 /DNA_ORIENTATION=-
MRNVGPGDNTGHELQQQKKPPGSKKGGSSSSNNNKKQQQPQQRTKRRSRAPTKSFEMRLFELQAFKGVKGHCKVPYGWEPNPSLAEWVKHVRRGCIKLSDEQRTQLNTLGFDWENASARFQREWMQQYDRLKAYKLEFGNCRVPWKYEPDQSLADWVCTQRKKHAKGKMRADRKKDLDAIGFTWNALGNSNTANANANANAGTTSSSASGNKQKRKTSITTTKGKDTKKRKHDNNTNDDGDANLASASLVVESIKAELQQQKRQAAAASSKTEARVTVKL